MNNTLQHWTEDSSLLEQFVLGKISEEGMAPLREHLKTCSACRKAVEQEAEFIKTVRAYGRDRLRHRLKERIEHSSSRGVPWPHVLSAAAVVLLIVGLGIYNRWWQEPDLVQSEEQIAAGGKEVIQPAPEAEAELDETTITGKTENAAAPGTGQPSRQEPAASSQAGTITNEIVKKNKRADQIAEEQKAPSIAARPREKVTADDLDTDKRRQTEFWVEGTLLDRISSKSGLRDEYRENDSAGISGRSEMLARPSDAKNGNYLLQQLPGSALPLEQQRLQQGIESVPTKVSPTGDGAILTIYSDIIDLQNRTVQGQIAGRDSVIFIVDGMRIVYKLPTAAVK